MAFGRGCCSFPRGDVYEGQGVSLAVIADLARLRAMKKELEGGATFVWFIDLDVHFTKNAKTACSQLPAAGFQHLIATMEGVVQSRAGYKATWRKGMVEFLRWPFGYQDAGTPFRVTSRTPLVDASRTWSATWRKARRKT